MDKDEKTINEIISELQIEDIKQDDLELECIKEEILRQRELDYETFPYENEYTSIVYQESKYYNPFTSSKENIV